MKSVDSNTSILYKNFLQISKSRYCGYILSWTLGQKAGDLDSSLNFD